MTRIGTHSRIYVREGEGGGEIVGATRGGHGIARMGARCRCGGGVVQLAHWRTYERGAIAGASHDGRGTARMES